MGRGGKEERGRGEEERGKEREREERRRRANTRGRRKRRDVEMIEGLFLTLRGEGRHCLLHIYHIVLLIHHTCCYMIDLSVSLVYGHRRWCSSQTELSTYKMEEL